MDNPSPGPASRRNPVWILLALPIAIAAWLLLHSLLPSLFTPAAEEALQAQATATYKEELAAYEAELAEYEAYKATYEQYLTQFQGELDAYEDTWRSSLEQYEQELQDYEDAKAIRQKAYDEAFAKAEDELLHAGIRFTVSAERQTESGDVAGTVWRDTLIVDGQKVREQPVLTLCYGNTLELRSEVTAEEDSSRSGSTTGTLSLTAHEFFTEGFTYQHRVTVPGPQGDVVFRVTYRFEPEAYTVKVNESALPALKEAPTKPEYAPPEPEQEAPGEAPVPPEEPQPVKLDGSSPSLRSTVYEAVPAARILDIGGGVADAAVCVWAVWSFLRRNSGKDASSPPSP